MLAFDTSTGQYLKFGSNRTIALAGTSMADNTKQLCYAAFDILKLGDTVLLDKPLKARRELLQKLVTPQANRFEVLKHRTDVSTSQGLLAALTEATGRGQEGIIVKDETSPYRLNDRSDYVRQTTFRPSSEVHCVGCFSPSLSLSLSLFVCAVDQSEAGLRRRPARQHGSHSHGRVSMQRGCGNAADHRFFAVCSLALCLIGARSYYGEGTRRSGDISHFLLGLHDHKLSSAEIAHYADRRKLPPKLYAFCKVGSGYTIARLKELRKELETKWQKYDAAKQPPHFMGWKHEKSDIPDVWIDPRDAPCFEIKCYGSFARLHEGVSVCLS